ncbi:MAG: succinylglutamate desuccinylase/aspartoacylase family protein [Lautropia sp.]
MTSPPRELQRIEVGNAVSEAPGRVDGMLRVGWLPDGAPMEIPVVIVRGREPGPVVWMHGCVHGNEYCSTFSLHTLLRGLELVRGAVVALPALNLTGFQRGQRMSPFEGYNGGDLNRCFPGKPGGTLTEQMAWHIYQPLRRYATHFVDVHTAFSADTRWALCSPPSGEQGAVALGMAQAFGFQHTLPTPLDTLTGSAMTEAAKAGIPGLIVEAGGIGPAFSPETVADSAERFRNVLRHLGLLSGKVVEHGRLTLFSNFAWVNATRGGLFRPAIKCGERVAEGQIVGRYYDVYGDLAEEAKSPFSGIVLAIAGGPVMPAGEILIHVGLDPQPA